MTCSPTERILHERGAGRGDDDEQGEVADPGEVAPAEGQPVGFAAWLAWQHFLNSLFLLLIIRTGWEVRTRQRPPAHWTRNNSGPIRTKGKSTKISLDLWLHLSLDALWVLNGIIFYVLLFATGQWMRVVPTSWEHLPNAVSAALQYASLSWPHENGWVNYNSLQLIDCFLTIFVAAPLAIRQLGRVLVLRHLDRRHGHRVGCREAALPAAHRLAHRDHLEVRTRRADVATYPLRPCGDTLFNSSSVL